MGHHDTCLRHDAPVLDITINCLTAAIVLNCFFFQDTLQSLVVQTKQPPPPLPLPPTPFLFLILPGALWRGGHLLCELCAQSVHVAAACLDDRAEPSSIPVPPPPHTFLLGCDVVFCVHYVMWKAHYCLEELPTPRKEESPLPSGAAFYTCPPVQHSLQG